MKHAAILVVACLALNAMATPSVGMYFANWAQYHAGKYKFMPNNLAGVLPMTDHILYAFAKFDPSSFQVQPVETDDQQFYQQITSLKASNPNFKFVLSVGGWTFPSYYFSQMVSTSSNRAAFISSAVSYLSSNGFDGIDIDWEYPCSEPRIDWIKITDTDFKEVVDNGGKCPDDKTNFASFIKELRAGLGPSKLIFIASQADMVNWQHFDLVGMSQYIDLWHVMTYDYTVSDLPDSNVTAPNESLYPPMSGPPIGVNYTIMGYINAGVKPSQISLGIAYYGHTWYVPNPPKGMWQSFGLLGRVQGKCFGPFKNTYGGPPGTGSQMCGTLMYSEIMDMNPQTFFDNRTQSAIAYTSDGLWVSYLDKQSLSSLVSYAKKLNLAGVFIFDASMDTIGSDGSFTFELTSQICNELKGPGNCNGVPPPPPTPPGPPTPPPPPGFSCTGKDTGYYCDTRDLTRYWVCPNDIEMNCAPGTKCSQASPTQIACT